MSVSNNLNSEIIEDMEIYEDQDTFLEGTVQNSILKRQSKQSQQNFANIEHMFKLDKSEKNESSSFDMSSK